MTDLTSAARVLSAYAKRHHAGGFATPSARDLAHRNVVMAGSLVAVFADLRRDSIRHDWRGCPFTLPGGTRIVTHLGRAGDEPVPPLGADFVCAYREDRALADALAAQGYVESATQITASSAIITTWGPERLVPPLSPADAVTLALVPVGPGSFGEVMADEALDLDGWHDDFPYYSDGSWSAINLRGFRPDDPTWGIKPAEMSRQWKQAHPEALHYRCGWTVASRTTPAIVEYVEGLGLNLERVRLLRMEGTGHGTLSRHTDITDRNAGTRNGHIVRYHVPLVTDPAIEMHAWTLDGRHLTRHLPPGSAWYLDARKPHAVTNPTTVDRIHLVIDLIADDRVRGQLA